MLRIEHRVRKGWTLRSVAPQPPVFPAAASKLKNAPRASSQRDRSLAPAFRSPAAVSACADSVPGSLLLPWRFVRLRSGSCARSVFWLRNLPLVCPSSGRHPRLRPVAFSPVRSSGRAASLHSPSGLFDPSGLKRSTGHPAFRSAFRIRPIFVRSPRPLISNRPRIIVPEPLLHDASFQRTWTRAWTVRGSRSLPRLQFGSIHPFGFTPTPLTG